MITINGFDITAKGPDEKVNNAVEKFLEYNKEAIAAAYRKACEEMLLYGLAVVKVR